MFGTVRFTRERLRGLHGASQLVAGTAGPGTTEDPDLVRLVDKFRDCVAASVTRSHRAGESSLAVDNNCVSSTPPPTVSATPGGS